MTTLAVLAFLFAGTACGETAETGSDDSESSDRAGNAETPIDIATTSVAPATVPTTTADTRPEPHRDLEDGESFVTAEDYGDEWPLTVPAGILTCVDDAVTFETDDGTVYEINGWAMTQDVGVDVEPIWADNPEIQGTKISMVLIDDGLDLCE